ncbi:MAG: hypothetical protein EOM17_05180 [Synergistales bacterium]|nr:hypothetical protein [Synergistales bacterium]
MKFRFILLDKIRKRYYIFSGIIFLIFIAALISFQIYSSKQIFNFLWNQTEPKIIHFISTSPGIIDEFGENLTVSEPEISQIHYCSDRKQGVEHYPVEGSKGKGKIEISWIMSRTPEKEIQVKGMRRIMPDGTKKNFK